MNTVMFIITLFFAGQAWGATTTAELFDMDGKKRFTYTATKTISGDTWSYVTEYKDLKGIVVVRENSKGKGAEISSYSIERPQTKEKGNIEVADGRVKYKYWNKFNRLEKEKEKVGKKPFIVGHTIVPFIQKNWSKLMKKEKAIAMLGVWFRKESITFRYYLKGVSTIDGVEVANFYMEPASFIFRQLVNPLVFSLNKETKELVQIKGRTLPKINKDGKLRNFDAVSKYKTVKPEDQKKSS